MTQKQQNDPYAFFALDAALQNENSELERQAKDLLEQLKLAGVDPTMLSTEEEDEGEGDDEEAYDDDDDDDDDDVPLDGDEAEEIRKINEQLDNADALVDMLSNQADQLNENIKQAIEEMRRERLATLQADSSQ